MTRKTASFRATNTTGSESVAEDFDALVNALTVSRHRAKKRLRKQPRANTPVIAQSVSQLRQQQVAYNAQSAVDGLHGLDRRLRPDPDCND